MKFSLSVEESFSITRIFVYLSVLWSFIFFYQGDFVGWLAIIPESAWTPVGVMEWLYPVFKFLKNSSWAGHFISAVMVISILSCVIGWSLRITSVLALVLSIIIFGLKNSFGHAFRSESVLIVAQVVFVFQANSLIDRLWTIRIFRGLWVSIFFFSALNKLKFSGLDWVLDNYVLDYMRANQITRAGILLERPFSGTVKFFIEHILVTKILGCFIFLFELCYPVIFFRSWRNAMLVVTGLFQVAVFILLGVNFFFYLPLVPIWFSKED